MPINREIPDLANDFADLEADIEANGVKLDTVNTNLEDIEADVEALSTTFTATDNTLLTKYLLSTLDNLLNEQKLTNLYLSQILGDELTL